MNSRGVSYSTMAQSEHLHLVILLPPTRLRANCAWTHHITSNLVLLAPHHKLLPPPTLPSLMYGPQVASVASVLRYGEARSHRRTLCKE